MPALLQDAIQLIKAGQKEQARALLIQILQKEPANEAAWLWLTECLTDDLQRIQALEVCLKFNPNSEKARKALQVLREKSAPAQRPAPHPPVVPTTPEPAPSSIPPEAQGLIPAREGKPEPPPVPPFTTPPTFATPPGGEIDREFIESLIEESRESAPRMATPPEKPAIQPFISTPALEESPTKAEIPQESEPAPADSVVSAFRKPERRGLFGKREALQPRRPSRKEEEEPKTNWLTVFLQVALFILFVMAIIVAALVTDLPSKLRQSLIPIASGGGTAVQPTALPGYVNTAPPPTNTPTPVLEFTPTPTLTPVPPLPTGEAGSSFPVYFSAQAFPLPLPLAGHTATRLQDGRLLIAGGKTFSGVTMKTFLLDSDRSDAREINALIAARAHHSATLLQDGRVLAVGGEGDSGIVQTADLFDPASESWSTLLPMYTHGIGHIAVRLNNDWVLIAGGCGQDATAELFDPVSMTWQDAGAPPYPLCRASATLLPDGRVLVAGGEGEAAGKALIYDLNTRSWTPTAPLQTPRWNHTALGLPEGDVILFGGQNASGQSLNAVEVYRWQENRWESLSPMNEGRIQPAVTFLPDGRIAVLGGYQQQGFAATLEVYFAASNVWSAATAMDVPSADFTLTYSEGMAYLLIGGESADGLLDRRTWLIFSNP